MIHLLLAASLQVFALATETPHHGAAKVEPAPPAREEPAPRAEAPAKGKNAAQHKAEEAEPVAAEPAAAPRPAPKVRRPAPPAPGPGAADLRAARLEAENAKLRQQLARNGNPEEITDAASALRELASGNERFVGGVRVRTLLSMQDPDLRMTLAKGQAPFAVIITCSDSRLADNLIFDQELGRLFTIREAGNSSDVQSLASVEYAVEHLGSRLVVVLGHVGCGAVQAVREANGRPLPGNLWALQAAMSGLLESTPADPNDTVATHLLHLVEHNAQRQAQAVLDRSELVRGMVAKGRVKVVPAVYDLASGKVTWLAAPATVAAAHP